MCAPVPRRPNKRGRKRHSGAFCWQKVPYANILSSGVLLRKIKGLRSLSAHCSHFCPQKVCGTPPGRSQSTAEFGCPEFRLNNKIVWNQSLSRVRLPLRTILSTEFVRNYTIPVSNLLNPASLEPSHETAIFLRRRRKPLQIKVLVPPRGHCAQFYPQKM